MQGTDRNYHKLSQKLSGNHLFGKCKKYKFQIECIISK